MAVIEVDGAGRFEVDEKFFNLPEDEQQALLRGLVSEDDALTTGDVLSGIGKGINVGMFADVLGAPVDLTTGAINLGADLLGADNFEIQRPIGGSKQLRGLLSDAGLGYESITDLPEKQRPFAIGGETFGASVPFAAGVGLAAKGANLATRARPTGSAIKDLLSSARDTAARKPVRFGASEAGLATAAGVGGGTAELLAPSNELARLGGELAGALGPTAALTAAGPAVDRVVQLGRSFTPSGRKKTAAEILQQRAVDEGIDPQDLSKKLLERDGGITSAQRVPEAFIVELENTLRSSNKDLDARLKNANDEVTENLKASFMAGDVSPEAFEAALDAQIAAKIEGARRAASRIGPSSPDAAEQANLVVRSALEDSLKSARKQESALWGRVDRNIVVDPEETLAAFKDVRGRLLDEERLPEPIEAFANRVKSVLKQDGFDDADIDDIENGVKAITSGDLLRFRSRLLAMARDEASGQNPNRSLAGQLGVLADGALSDLSRMSVDGVDVARTFSRTLNERFSRGEVGKVLEFDYQSSSKVAPELTLNAIRRGGPAAAVAEREFMTATQPIGEGAPQTDIAPQIQEFLSDMARKTVTKSTGEVKPEALATFRDNNRQILRQYPQLDRALSDAANAQRLVDEYTNLIQRGSSINNVTALGETIRVRKPVAAVKNAVANFDRSPAQMDAIVDAAIAGGEQSISGLRSILIEELLDSATTSGRLSGKALKENLRQTKVLDYLREKGVVDAKRQANLNKLADAAETIESYRTTRTGKFDLGKTSPIEDFLIRVVGARIGALSLIGEATGASLVAAGAGSKALRALLSDMPALRVRDVLARAVEEPDFMAELLSKPTSVRARNARDTRILAYLLASGLVAEDE